MLGQYGLFEEELKHYSGDDKLDVLYELIGTPAGQEISLELYLQENWSYNIAALASYQGEDAAREKVEHLTKDEHAKEFAYDKNQYPTAVFKKGSTRTAFANPEKIVQLLRENDTLAIYESQMRCAYQKPDFIKEHGLDAYQKPLSNYLGGFAKNEDCDGISSITIDFDSSISREEMENNYIAPQSPSVLKKRSLAAYALSVNIYALQFKEELPFELQPTAIRFTGRGFQFIYDLQYTYYFNRDKKNNNKEQESFTKDTIMWLRRSLEMELEAFHNNIGYGIMSKEGGFTLDKAFENNLYQLRRVPGSLNKKSGLYAAYIYLSDDLLNDKHTLQDLIDFCKENYRETYYLKNQTIKYINKPSGEYTPVESLLFAKTRLTALTKIIDLRYQTNTLVGSRHNFLTQITNCIADIEKLKRNNTEPSYESIFNQVVSFHVKHFKEKVLKQNEVVSAVKGAMKRREKILKRGDSTNLGNQVIVNFLDLTPEEEGIFRGVTKTTKQKSVTLQNKMNRFETAVAAHALYEEGYTYEAIAESLDLSVSSAHRYVSIYYPKWKEEKKVEIIAEKNRLKEQQKVTQRYLYDCIYERMTRLIVAKKITSKIYDWLKEVDESTRLNDYQIAYLTSLMSPVIQEAFFNIFQYAPVTQMKHLRNNLSILCQKLFASKSFKNILNEYIVIAVMDKSDMTPETNKLIINKLAAKFEYLLHHVYWKEVEKFNVPKLKAFYPNGFLAKQYYEHQEQLLFPLFETKGLIQYKYNLPNNEQYTKRYLKNN